MRYTIGTMDFVVAVYVLLQKYLIPAIFVIGILYYLYGIINYFILPYANKGKVNFLVATLWFVAGLLIYGVVTFFGATSAWFSSLGEQNGSSGFPSAGVEIEKERALLPVPNPPTSNPE